MVITNDKWSVYIHTNKINGKKYVGITSRKPEVRWGNDGCGYRQTQIYFYNAIQKYGWDNFEHEILFTNLTENEAKEKETELIKTLHTCVYDDKCNGYNMTFGGDGMVGWKPSVETRQKMSKSKLGEKNSFYGKHHSQETKLKFSKYRRGKNVGKDNPFYMKTHTEETKKKLSEYASNRTGEKNSNYNNHKLSGENHPMYGKHLSEETKKKISESRKGKYFGKNSPSAKPVYCHETKMVYPTIKEASKQLNVDASSISKCCRGVYKNGNIKGYHFRFATEEDYGRY